MEELGKFLVNWINGVKSKEEKVLSEESDPIARNRLKRALLSHGLDITLPIHVLVEATRTTRNELFQQLERDWKLYKERLCEPMRIHLTTGSGPDARIYDDLVKSVTIDNCFNGFFWTASKTRFLESTFPVLSRYLPLDYNPISTSRKRGRSEDHGITSGIYIGFLLNSCRTHVDHMLIQHAATTFRRLYIETNEMLQRSISSIHNRVNSHVTHVPDYKTTLRKSVTKMHSEWMDMLIDPMSDEAIKRDFIDVLLSDEKKEGKVDDDDDDEKKEGVVSWEMLPILMDISNYCYNYINTVMDMTTKAVVGDDNTPLSIHTLNRYTRPIETDVFVRFIKEKTDRQASIISEQKRHMSGRPDTHPVTKRKFVTAINKDIASYARKIGNHLMGFYTNREEKKQTKTNIIGSFFSSSSSSPSSSTSSLQQRCRSLIGSLSKDIDHPEITLLMKSIDETNIEIQSITRTKAEAVVTHITSICDELLTWATNAEDALEITKKRYDEYYREYRMIQPTWISALATESDMTILQEKTREIKDIVVPSLFRPDHILATIQFNVTLPRSIHSLTTLFEAWIKTIRALELKDAM
jgi:hypothetical protein